jgi:hypothetical protein
MRFRKDKTDVLLDEISERKAHLSEEIERLIKSEADKSCTLPPPDDIVVRTEQVIFEELVNEGQLRNTQRELTRAKTMMVLLVLAACAVLLWSYRALQDYGLLQ